MTSAARSSVPAGDLRLLRAVIELEQHVAGDGWDQQARLYALVETDALLAEQPALAAHLGRVGGRPAELTSIEQEELPAYASLDELLSGIAWPSEVSGTALVVERVMLPPEAEAALPEDDAEAMTWVAGHAQRQDVRIAVAVLRDGSRQCAVRMRTHDSDEAVLSGPDLVPGLAHALAGTLLD